MIVSKYCFLIHSRFSASSSLYCIKTISQLSKKSHKMWWRKINIFHIMTECHIHIYLKKKMHLLLQTKKCEFGHFSCANFIAFAGLIKIIATKLLCIDAHLIDTYNIVPIWVHRKIIRRMICFPSYEIFVKLVHLF